MDVADILDAILTQEDDDEPLNLRMSGQLMLGVVRIYGRKVQYLMDDCKDMRERITMAFRPGVVDLPQDQIRASKTSITFTELAPNVDMIDILDWSFQVPTADYAPSSNRNTAPPNQTNLRSREFGAFNFGRPAVLSIYGDGSSRQGSPFGSSTSHLDSQDFSGVDLGLNLEEWDESMEIGRDAQRSRSKSTTLSMRGSSVMRDDNAPMDTDNFGVEEDFNPVDLDLGLDDLPELTSEGPAPGTEGVIEEGVRDLREASTLSTPPPESPHAANLTIDVSPRTARRIADAQQQKPKRVRIVRADEELELADDEFAPPKDDDSEILGVERFIPADPEAVRLRDIIDDPASHFLPTVKVNDVTMIFAGPNGLAPELAELFMFPVNVLRRTREPEPERPNKRARSMTSELSDIGDEPMEEARRQSRIPSEAGFEPDFGGFDNDMSFDFGGITSPPPGDVEKIRAPSLAPSIAQSIAAQSVRSVRGAEEGESKLMIFDPRVSASQMTSSSEETQRDAGGVSKSTGMAMGLLRAEIEAIDAEDKSVSFDELSRGASKRAASTGFFELLVLATRDCIKLEQKKPFGDIHIRAKDRLWEATPLPQTQTA